MRILKRAFSLLLMLALASTTVGGATASAPDFTGDDAISAAEGLYMHLIEGEFDTIIEMLDDSIKQMLSADALAAGYETEIAPNGAFVEFADKNAINNNGGFIATLVAQHEAGQAQLTCVFSPAGKITGMGITNLTAAAETADPLPLDLPAGAQERAVVLHAGTEKELKGALVLPEGFSENTPAVVLVHGSGVSDLDETVGPQKPFRDIAYGLAEHGIASLRYDKLHYAHPELATVDTTIEDEYTDTVLEALAVLRAEEALGSAYLLGHSEGGMLTPYLMQKSEGGFAGGIIYAGTPRQLWELIVDQNLALLEGAPEETIAAATAQLDAEKEKLPTLEAMSADELRQTRVFNMPGPYVAYLLSIDPVAIALENNAPLLIMQGEEDFQVYDDVDFVLWQEGLKDMGDLVTYKSYPGLNHIFMTARGSIADVMEAYGTPDLVDEGVIKDMADWINGQN